MVSDQILTADNREAHSSIEDNSIQTIVSSPMYYAARDYPANSIYLSDDTPSCIHEWIQDLPCIKDNVYYKESEPNEYQGKYQIYHFCIKCGAWRGKLGHEPNYRDRYLDIDGKTLTIRGFISHLADVYSLYYTKLKAEGSLFVIIGDCFASKTRGRVPKKGEKDGFKPILLQLDEPDGSQLMIPFYFADEMKNRGWHLKQIPIWRKPNPMTSSNRRKWTMDYENILWFVKDLSGYYFNTQYEPKKVRNARSKNAKNKHAGYGTNTMSGFKYDAKNKTHKIARASPLIPEDNETIPLLDNDYIDEGSVETNLMPDWVEIPPKGTKLAHFATMPARLIFPLISATTQKNDLVADIFSGLGTTGLVALAMGRNYLGIEINGKYNELYAERKKTEFTRFQNQYRLFLKQYFPVKCGNILNYLQTKEK